MSRIKIDLSGSGGLVQSSPKSLEQLIYWGDENQMVSGTYNPFKYPGYLSPTQGTYRTMTYPTDGRALSVTCIYDYSSGKFIVGSQNGYLNVWSSLDTTSASTETNLSISTLAIWDFEVYQLNGTRKVFFSSFNSSGLTGYVGVTDGTTFTYNWSNGSTSTLYTGTVTGSGTFSNPPFMRVASNGYMYIFDGNKVHKVDGTTAGGTAGTITANVLTVNKTQFCVDGVDWKNLMYIAVQDVNSVASTNGTDTKSSECGIFIWDRVSTVLSSRDFIPLYGVKTLKRLYVAHDGKLRLICISADNKTQIREYTGNSFEVIFELNYTAAPQYWDALTISGYATFWVAEDKTIYAHGRAGNGFPNAVYKLSSIFGTVTSNNVGFLYYANGGEASGAEALFQSAITSISSGKNIVQKQLFNYIGALPTDFTGGLPNVDTTVIKTKVKQLPFLSNTESIMIFFAPSTGSTGATVVGSIKIYLNGSTTAFKTYNVTRNDIVKGYCRIPLNKQYVNSIQIGIDYSTYAGSTTSGISNDMMPYYALLDYSQTNTDK